MVVTGDASSYGLGAVLIHTQSKGHQRLVAFISRHLLDTEQHYAQVEKEDLTDTWACERLNSCILGLNFKIETDHCWDPKPWMTFYSKFRDLDNE